MDPAHFSQATHVSPKARRAVCFRYRSWTASLMSYGSEQPYPLSIANRPAVDAVLS
jgi:hypothetical protein